MIEQLNADHAIDNHISFQVGEGGLAKAVIANQFATAELYLNGGHVTAFQPVGQAPVLWMSSQAEYHLGQALRGGIPVAWPSFGAHPTDKSKPSHGFARTSEWSVSSTEALADGRTQLRLQLVDSEASRKLWPYSFELTLTVTVGATLRVVLTTRNAGSISFHVGTALHTYFHVGDIDQVEISGLDGRAYLDKVTGFDRKHQAGSIRIDQEVDRVYLDTTDECIIHDTALGRAIHVGKEGSRSTVVWNPWSERAKAMGDLPDDGYKSMVCVETTNAADDVRSIPPGGEHTVVQVISIVEPTAKKP